MAQMETDLPGITNSCEERNRLSLEIEALDIVINRCTELVNFPDTDDNHEMKAILRASIDDIQRKKDTMVSELRSLPPCMTFNCNGNYCTLSPPIPTEKHKDSDSNHILKNYSEAPTNANNAKKKKKKKKRKINTKDSVEDFVFPKKTARPVSPLPSEPVTVNNSFSDLESENDKDQVAPEENNETVPPKLKPPPLIHLKTKKNIRDQLKSIYQKFPDITNKSNYHLKPRCLKCGKEHPTRQCPIKKRQENPFCINCQEYGHSACYTKCPKFLKPKKGTPLTANKTFESNVRREGVSFANIVSGTAPSSTPTPVYKLTEKTNENSNNKVSHAIQAIENENSDLAQVIELISMISNIIKRSPEILQLLPKLKNSEDDKAKALLLFEAMLDKF
ncbi:uncharacterized protein TNCV_3502291 [Trichonephila clavipes]|uniref:Gag-like protein n=1 Tax=Trichonephila clavipes TaxID=2585209 RepID=A0A8X6V2M7_TRICX|nr:uncharacterized protein TNCV_3502291 [Trichonephila clavipes]